LEDQGLPLLLENEVIMFAGAVSRWLNSQFAAHSKMNSNPIPGREFEQQLFSSRKGMQKPASG